EIADGTDLAEADIDTARKIVRPALSLDLPTTNERGENPTTLLDLIPDTATPDPQEQAFAGALNDVMRAAVNRLGECERRMIQLYFGWEGFEPMSLEEIGQMFGITRERVRQVKERGLMQLRRLAPSLGLDTLRT